MRHFIIYTLLAFTVVTISCDKDDDNSTAEPFPVNNSITPNNFLSSAKYDQLIVEIQYVSGYQPTAAAVSNLQAFLEARLNKPAGITITQQAIPSPGKS